MTVDRSRVIRGSFAVAAAISILAGVVVGAHIGDVSNVDVAREPSALIDDPNFSTSEDLDQTVKEQAPVTTADDLRQRVSEGVEEIRVGPVVIELDSPLAISRPLRLIGDGFATTTLRSTHEGPVIVIESAGDVSIQAMTIESGSTANPGDVVSAFIARQATFDLDKLRVRSAAGDGLYVIDSIGSVSESTFENNGGSGVWLTGSSNVEIRASEAMGNRRHGFGWTDTASGLATSNRSTNNSANGFEVESRAEPILNGNESSENRGNGYSWSQNARGLATGNTATSNQAAGFEVRGSADPQLEANRTDDSSLDITVGPAGRFQDLTTAIAAAPSGGIVYLSAGVHELAETAVVNKPLTIRGAEPPAGNATTAPTTILRSSSSEPVIIVLGVTDGSLIDVRIESTTTQVGTDRFASLAIIDSTFDITSVVVADGDGHGLVYENSSGSITQSKFESNEFGGVRIINGSPTLRDNLAVSNGSHGFEWSGTASGSTSGNQAISNGGNGFEWRENSSGDATNNQAIGNTRSGFLVLGDAAPRLRSNCAESNTLHGFEFIESATAAVQHNRAFRNGSPTLTGEYAGFAWFAPSAGSASNNVAGGNSFSPQFHEQDGYLGNITGSSVIAPTTCPMQ